MTVSGLSVEHDLLLRHEDLRRGAQRLGPVQRRQRHDLLPRVRGPCRLPRHERQHRLRLCRRTYSNRWDNSTPVTLGDGIQGAWLDWFQGGSLNRTGYSDLLTRDALSWASSTPTETFKITGLVPGTYNLTLYGIDLQCNDKQTSYSIDQDNNGTTDVSTTIRNTLSETSKTVSVTISAAGILKIAVVSINGAGGAFNGLDLVPTGGGGDTTAPAAVSNLAAGSPTHQQSDADLDRPGRRRLDRHGRHVRHPLLHQHDQRRQLGQRHAGHRRTDPGRGGHQPEHDRLRPDGRARPTTSP